MPTLRVVGIDPGPTWSALVEWLVEERRAHLGRCVFAPNGEILCWLRRDLHQGILVVEQVESFGMPVGAHVFETVYWTGRFVEAWDGESCRLTFRHVKLHHCHHPRATESHVRQAILNRYGGTRKAAVGTKKAPGPLYGIRGHLWSALALAMTVAENYGTPESKQIIQEGPYA
jgi:hypothetical protein